MLQSAQSHGHRFDAMHPSAYPLIQFTSLHFKVGAGLKSLRGLLASEMTEISLFFWGTSSPERAIHQTRNDGRLGFQSELQRGSLLESKGVRRKAIQNPFEEKQA